jgi:hypothetical protein
MSSCGRKDDCASCRKWSIMQGRDAMDTHTTPTGPDPLDTHEELRVAGLTGMTTDAAKTFLAFHTGMRWLHRDPEPRA